MLHVLLILPLLKKVPLKRCVQFAKWLIIIIVRKKYPLNWLEYFLFGIGGDWHGKHLCVCHEVEQVAIDPQVYRINY